MIVKRKGGKILTGTMAAQELEGISEKMSEGGLNLMLLQVKECC